MAGMVSVQTDCLAWTLMGILFQYFYSNYFISPKGIISKAGLPCAHLAAPSDYEGKPPDGDRG
jgi:hypothetical protein